MPWIPSVCMWYPGQEMRLTLPPIAPDLPSSTLAMPMSSRRPAPRSSRVKKNMGPPGPPTRYHPKSHAESWGSGLGEQWARLMDPDFEKRRKSDKESRYTPRSRRDIKFGSRIRPPAKGTAIPEDRNIVKLLETYRQTRREEESANKPEMFVIK